MEDRGGATNTNKPDSRGGHERSGATARWVGALFLAAFALYGVGALLVDRATGDGIASEILASRSQLRSGALLILANAIAVVAIGVLMYRVAESVGMVTRLAYFGARLFEGIVLAMGAVAALTLIPAAESTSTDLVGVVTGSREGAYQVAMIGLCAGSIPLFWALVNARAMPRWLGAWGAVGYVIFGIGAALEIGGVSAGIILSIPGGIFEVTLAVYLLWRGAFGASTE